MKNEFNKHKQSDRVKWVVAFAAILALIVGFFAIVSNGFSKKPTEWFAKEQTEITATTPSETKPEESAEDNNKDNEEPEAKESTNETESA